jgi:two-component system CheB/CheR fusion protein
VLFHEDMPGTGEPSDTPAAVMADDEVLQLRRELVSMRDYLQALIEQQSSSTEDLRAANEEILSGNEELQSANEELETAKEELQCANEELTTVNEQLHQRNADLLRANHDLVNFLSSADLPLMMVDQDLRLQRITDAARRILGLHMQDTGFPISYLQAALPVPDIALQVQRVMASLAVWEAEIQDASGRWYLLRVHPYRGSGSEADGAVLVMLDIDARKWVEESLLQAQQRKSEFLATVAHELRNPLGPIRQAVDMLQHEANGGRAADAVAIMDRQVRQLTYLITDLVDITVLGGEHIRLRPERVRLEDVIPSVLDPARGPMEDKQLRLVTELPEAPIFIEADPVRLGQVLGNVLDNAIKFSKPGGQITLRVTREQHAGMPTAVFDVQDEGAGIPAELLPHVFELFWQGEQKDAARHRGFGIGLNLAQRLVALHHGDITVSSPGPNRGTRVSIRLPEAAPPTADARRPTSASEIASRRILLVDDNEDQTAMLQTLLELAGHEVAVASDGTSGLALAREFRPEVAILDIGLPDMSGHELARAFRADPVLGKALLVAQTGWGQASDRAAGAAAGFDVHLVKPVSFEQLETVLRERTNGADT